MRGIVADENGSYVKAAIVKLYKVKDAGGESDAEFVTYAETDEEGNFLIQDLNPDEKYIIEIHAEYPETGIKADAEAKQKPEAETETAEVLKAEAAEVLEAEAAFPDEGPKVKLEPKAEVKPEQEPEAELKQEQEPYEVIGPDPGLDLDYEEEAYADEYNETEFLIDFAAEDITNQTIVYTVTENISVGNLYTPSGIDLKDKPYLMKTNLW